MSDCEHAEIRTFRAVSEPEVVVLWACANLDCSRRFYPACPTCVDVGHRNVEHVEDPERQAAVALLGWYDRTHGNGFGHDHHCPVPWTENPFTAEPDDRCTCGWSAFLRADRARQEAAK